MDPAELRRAIEQLLESQPDNKRLRDHLEGVARDPTFPGLTWFWGPRLYARSRPFFRPFILQYFSDWMIDGRRWKQMAWHDHAKELEGWLKAAREVRDAGLVRRL